MSDSGMNNTCIATALGASNFTVSHWRNRYIREGQEGLHDEFRSSRPRSVSDEAIAMLVNKTLQSQPEGATNWTIRSIASKTGLEKSTVHRIWQAFGLQPHKQRSFKLSTDPLFVEKVRDIVGLYLNPDGSDHIRNRLPGQCRGQCYQRPAKSIAGIALLLPASF